MEKTTPKISILLAVFNAERFIASTMDSILEQSYKDWELIVQDGASKDKTVEIVKGYMAKHDNIKLFSEPDKGQGDALYKASLQAKGEFLIYSSASDGYLTKEWFAKCVEVFESDPAVSLVWGMPFDMTEEGALEGPHYTYAHFWDKAYMPEEKFGPMKDISFASKLMRRVTAHDGGSFVDWMKKVNIFRMTNLVHAIGHEDVPQKEAWFDYWLKTGCIFPDGNMLIARKAFFECMPAYSGEPSPNWMEFFYNFNARGYLAYCLPIPANYGRIHAGHLGEAVMRFNLNNRKEYYEKLGVLRKQIQSGKSVVKFIDRSGNDIKK